MARTITDICNRALVMVGAERITSIDDTSKPASLCAALYPDVLDELLADHPWNFATRRAALPAADAPPEWGFDRAFPLPADCLRVLRLSAGVDDSWKVEGRHILANLGAPLRVLYLARVTDPSAFSPAFTAALQTRLAAELVMPLTQGATQQDALMRLADRRLREARSRDAAEGQPDRVAADTFIDARRGAVT